MGSPEYRFTTPINTLEELEGAQVDEVAAAAICPRSSRTKGVGAVVAALFAREAREREGVTMLLEGNSERW